MSNESRELDVIYEVDGQEIKLTQSIIEQYIVGSGTHITLPEFKFFTELCKARKLNPFLKEAYCIKFGEQPAQIVVSKDVFLKRAVLHHDYNGIEDGIIVTNDKGEIIERKGCFKLPTEKIVGGWAKVYRKNWEYPVYCSVSFDEVAQKKKDGNLNSNWNSKPATMVNKVAVVRALRSAFVDEFAGMYEESEFITPDNANKDNDDIPIVQAEPNTAPVIVVEKEVTMDDL